MDTRVQKLEEQGLIDHTRARDWFDPLQSQARVTLVGCGGIGSPTALGLSKLGIPYLTLIDDDVIEPHNVPNQFYPISSKTIGAPKVEMLKKLCEAFGSSEVTERKMKFQEDPRALSGIVVSGLDSMEAREQLWTFVKNSPSVSYLVDGRLSGLDITLWTINVKDKEDIEQYEQWALYSDQDADEQPCTARAVIDVALYVAAMITTQVRLLVTGGQSMNVERLLSFNVPTHKMEVW